jgi:hypothetical protein
MLVPAITSAGYVRASQGVVASSRDRISEPRQAQQSSIYVRATIAMKVGGEGSSGGLRCFGLGVFL